MTTKFSPQSSTTRRARRLCRRVIDRAAPLLAHEAAAAAAAARLEAEFRALRLPGPVRLPDVPPGGVEALLERAAAALPPVERRAVSGPRGANP